MQIKNGTAIGFIQALQGDSGLTAEIYMDVSGKSILQVKSPFNYL